MLDQSTINQILLTARASVGQPASVIDTDASGEAVTRPETVEEYEARFMGKVAELTALVRSKKSAARALAEAMADEARTKVFRGKVDRIIRDKKSTRGVVLLDTGNDRPATYKVNGQEHAAPVGFEVVRTDRTDEPYGLAMARKVKSLAGQPVMVWVELQVMANGNKVRVLRHIEPATSRQDDEEKAE